MDDYASFVVGLCIGGAVMLLLIGAIVIDGPPEDPP